VSAIEDEAIRASASAIIFDPIIDMMMIAEEAGAVMMTVRIEVVHAITTAATEIGREIGTGTEEEEATINAIARGDAKDEA